jgi:hypothetical protein
MKCTHCNTELVKESKFCHHCGNPVIVEHKLIPNENFFSWGYVDDFGNVIISHKYDYASEFKDGLACVEKDHNSAYINPKGEIVIGWFHPSMEVWGNFSEGLIYVGCWRNGGSDYRYYNRNGQIVISGDFHSASDFKNGLALVSYCGKYSPADDYFDAEYVGKKWGLIDKSGKIVKELNYTYVGEFHDGMAIICREKLYGYIDENFIEVIAPKYSQVKDFQEGYAAVYTDLKVWIFIDKEGSRISKRVYDNIAQENGYREIYGYTNGLAPVSNYDKWGYIDTNGREVIPTVYDVISHFVKCNRITWMTLACVRKDGKWAIINNLNREIVPFIYDDAYYYWRGVFIVERNGKTGLLKKSGEKITDCIYDDFALTNGSYFKTNRNGKWGIIDLYGQELIPCKYDAFNDFSEGYAWVRLNGKWGTVNTQGEIIIPYQFENEPLPFINGISKVCINETSIYMDYLGNGIDATEGYCQYFLND